MESDSSTNSSGGASSPEESRDSKGSSVSTGLREEYEDLLRYAVVTPNFDGKIKGVLKQQSHNEEATPAGACGPGVHSVQVSHLDIPDYQEEGDNEPVDNNECHYFPAVSPPHPQPSANNEPKVSFKMETNKAKSNDHEVMRLSEQMDRWCSDLKRNVLAEFEQAQIRSREEQKAATLQEINDLVSQNRILQSQINRINGLLTTYQLSINKKDEIIQRLTKSLQKQKDRIGLARSFSMWRGQHNDEKREIFTSALAVKHYDYKLKRKVLQKWFGIIQNKWRERVQKACQVRAEEICQRLKASHTKEIKTFERLLEEREEELSRLYKERDSFEENLKKAFMRGVCALNKEAMTMFNKEQLGDCGYHGNQTAPPPPPPPVAEGRKSRDPKVMIEKHLH